MEDNLPRGGDVSLCGDVERDTENECVNYYNS
jgi:hypothetical protein